VGKGDRQCIEFLGLLANCKEEVKSAADRLRAVRGKERCDEEDCAAVGRRHQRVA
jgi:hypothetical protein